MTGRYVFRVDASEEIGTGHLMRCLTLGSLLLKRGAEVNFICRDLPKPLYKLIASKGLEVHALSLEELDSNNLSNDEQEVMPQHASWLGVDYKDDANQVITLLKKLGEIDFLVVDHYGIEARWHRAVRPYVKKVFVIDDLADRCHDCDFLLDQNLARSETDYVDLIPEGCQYFLGPKYALLRPEFSRLRSASLGRRKFSRPQEILITMGGADLPNASGIVLDALNEITLLKGCQVKVIIGGQSRWKDVIRSQAEKMSLPTEVLIDVDNMAELMLQSDLSIGAAGSTSWERCCLGLPSMLVVLAENQKSVAEALENEGAAILLGSVETLKQRLISQLPTLLEPNKLAKISQVASSLTEGDGASLIVEAMENAI